MVRERKPHRRVFGEVYEIPGDDPRRALRELDKYEGPEFVRQRAFVTLSDGKRRSAWTYVLRDPPPRSARPVDSGTYSPKRGAA